MANATRLQNIGPDELLSTYPDRYLSRHSPADRLPLPFRISRWGCGLDNRLGGTAPLSYAYGYTL
jgi:hypothetical protein